MRNLKIRKYTEEDFYPFVDLVTKHRNYIQKINKLGFYDTKKDSGLFLVKKHLADVKKSDGVIMLAEINGNLIGCGVGVLDERKDLDIVKQRYRAVGLIKNIFVAAKYRNQGVATEIINQIELYFKKIGCASLRLEVLENNNNAKKLYKELGYENYLSWMIKVIK